MMYVQRNNKLQWVAITLSFLFGFMGMHHLYLGKDKEVGVLKTIVAANWFLLYGGQCNINLVYLWGIIVAIYWLVSFWKILKMSRHKFISKYN